MESHDDIPTPGGSSRPSGKTTRDERKAILTAIAAAVSLSFLSVSTYAIFKTLFDHVFKDSIDALNGIFKSFGIFGNLLTPVVGLCIGALGGWLLKNRLVKLKNRLFAIRPGRDPAPAAPKKQIVLFVSGLKKEFLPEAAYDEDTNQWDFSKLILESKQSKTIKEAPMTGNFIKDKELLKERSHSMNWLPMIRALAPHHKKLKRVILMFSEQSAENKVQARALVAQLLPAVEISDFETSFNDFDVLRNGVEEAINAGTSKLIRDESTVIDVTGGTKIVSIVGASFTVGTDIVIQYTNTGYPWEVFEYDLAGNRPVDF